VSTVVAREPHEPGQVGTREHGSRSNGALEEIAAHPHGVLRPSD
jgi:hypothetical protein